MSKGWKRNYYAGDSRKKQYHTNRRKCWECPYFKWDEPNFISCECGRHSFPSRQAATEYMTDHCADIQGWKECSLARKWNDYLEEKNESKSE